MDAGFAKTKVGAETAKLQSQLLQNKSEKLRKKRKEKNWKFERPSRLNMSTEK